MGWLGLIQGLATGLIRGLTTGLTQGLTTGLIQALITGLIRGWVSWLLIRGLSSGRLREKLRPCNTPLDGEFQ